MLNLFLLGMECQELAPVPSRVDLALQYRKDWPTPQLGTSTIACRGSVTECSMEHLNFEKTEMELLNF